MFKTYRFLIAIMDCKLWAIDRHVFQNIMMKTGIIRQREYKEFLKSVPIFRKLADETIMKIVDVLEEVNSLRSLTNKSLVFLEN